MQSISILFYLLKSSPCITIQTQDGNIAGFAYELFTKFDHEIDPNDKSIFLKQIQRNTKTVRDGVQEIIEKYSEKMPAINQLKRIFNLMEDGEYFMIIVNRKPSYEKTYEYYSEIISLNSPNFDIEKHLRDGTELFKNIWDNYDLFITRNNTRQLIGEKDRQKRICRFCGRTMADGASFKKEAHAISDALGNKTVILMEECDECNEHFGKTIEQDLLVYLNLYRTFFGIMNRDNKIPTIKGKNFEYRNNGNRNISLEIIDDGTNTFPDDPSLPPDNILLKYYEKITSQNIYKALVKYALSVIDRSKISRFDKTINWIRDSNNFKQNLPKIAVLASYELFKEKPLLTVYVRKTDNNNIPYAVAEFHFTLLTFVYIIPTFSDEEKQYLSDEEYKEYWKFFKYYDLAKEFKFESFVDSVNREVQFSLNFVQKTS
jgi:hypothetical protein